MKNGFQILYQCFGIAIYGIAVALLFLYSYYLEELEHRLDRSMYQQHAISCEMIDE